MALWENSQEKDFSWGNARKSLLFLEQVLVGPVDLHRDRLAYFSMATWIRKYYELRTTLLSWSIQAVILFLLSSLHGSCDHFCVNSLSCIESIDLILFDL